MIFVDDSNTTISDDDGKIIYIASSDTQE